MSATLPSIPPTHRDLLKRTIVVTLVTLMPDGQPQASPVWFSYDGAHIWVNSAKGRQKDKNMRARPQVTVLVVDPDDTGRALEVRGVVDEITEDGALDHINQLSARYDNRPDFFANKPEVRHTQKRVIYKIRPIHFVGH
jgi:PPOX class probable F420-dependent enzyme